MKLKNILLSLIAGASVIFGCTPEYPVSNPTLAVNLNPSVLNFNGKTAEEAEVVVTATESWTVSIPTGADWVTVTPSSANAGTVTVKISVPVGGEAERSAELIFKAGKDSKILSVHQAGGTTWGTKENPYTCAKAVEFCATLADKAKGPKQVYVKGIITNIIEKYGTQYGNATFFMSDDGSLESPQFEVYRALYFDNQKYSNTSDPNISVGDEVVIYGTIMNYGGQAETSQNEAYLISMKAGSNPVLTASPATVTVAASDTEASFDVEVKNISSGWSVTTDAAWITDYTKSGTESGKITVKFDANTGAERTAVLVVKAAGVNDVELTLTQAAYQENGTAEKPYTVAEALEVINALEDGATTATDVYVKGIISSISSIDTGSYGNATYLISADGSVNNTITVFRGYYLEGEKFTAEDQLAAGDVVVIKGKLQKYVKDGAMTPEIAAKNSVVTLDRPITVAAALATIDTMEDGKTADEPIYIKGIVTGESGIDTNYGNATFKLTDDGKAESAAITVFRAKDFGNEKFTDAEALKDGDTVVLIGQLQRYVKDGVMTPELSKGYLIAILPKAE